MTDEQNKQETNPNWRIQPAPGQKVLWMKCRGRENCTGNQVVLMYEQKQGTLGISAGVFRRYRCLTCATDFNVSF